jgi:hypothetical protein
LKGIYGFKFPKRFLEISSRDLTSSLLLFLFSQSKDLITQSLVPSIRKAKCLATKQSKFPQFIRPMSLLSNTSKTKTDCIFLKYLLNSNWRKEMNAMPALLKYLVLIALFLSASNANAFLSLSSATGTQVRINHLI